MEHVGVTCKFNIDANLIENIFITNFCSSLVSEEPQTRGICGDFHGGVRREASLFNQIYDKTPTDLLSAYLTKWNESVRLNRAEDLMLQPNHKCRAGKRKLGTLRSRK